MYLFLGTHLGGWKGYKISRGPESNIAVVVIESVAKKKVHSKLCHPALASVAGASLVGLWGVTGTKLHVTGLL
jgi:hypothetical protein